MTTHPGPAENDERAELDARIAALTDEVACTDDPGKRGLLAAIMLDRYELTDGADGPDDLHSVIAHAEVVLGHGWLADAVRPLLAAAHFYLAARWERPGHLVDAIDLFSCHLQVTTVWEQDEQLAAIRLGEAVWLRACSERTQMADLEFAIDALDRVRTGSDLSDEARAYSGLLLGYLCTVWSTEQRTDRPGWPEMTDRALRLLTEARASAPDGDEDGETASLTVQLHWRRYLRDEDAPTAAADLDATIADGRIALAWDPDDADGYERLGLALEDRYRHTEDAADRDGAIDAFTAFLTCADPDDPTRLEVHGLLGEALLERAERRESRVDLDAAIEHLTAQRDALPVGDPDRMLGSSALAEAYLQRGGGELQPHENIEIIGALEETVEYWPADLAGRDDAMAMLASALIRGVQGTMTWRRDQEDGLALLRRLRARGLDPELDLMVTGLLGATLAMQYLTGLMAGTLGATGAEVLLGEAIDLLEEALAGPELAAEFAPWGHGLAGVLIPLQVLPAFAHNWTSRIDRGVGPDDFPRLPASALVDLDRAEEHLRRCDLDGLESQMLLVTMLRLGIEGHELSDADLDEVIDAASAVRAGPLSDFTGSIAPPIVMAVMLGQRARRSGSTDDAARAIALHREGLAELPDGHTMRVLALDDLAALLTDRRFVAADRQSAAMAEAIDALVDLVDMAEVSGPRWRHGVGRLSGTLLDSLRLERGALRPGRAVTALRGAIAAVDDPDPLWSAALATALTICWQVDRRGADAEEAVRLVATAVGAPAEIRSGRIGILLGGAFTLLRIGALDDRPELIRAGLGHMAAARPLLDDSAATDLLGPEQVAELRRATHGVDLIRAEDGLITRELLVGLGAMSAAEVERLRPGVADFAGLLVAGLTEDPHQVRAAVTRLTRGARAATPRTAEEAELMIRRGLALVESSGPAVAVLDEAAALLEAGLVVELTDEGCRAAHLAALGQMRLELHRLTGDPTTIRRAVETLEQSRAAARGAPPSGDTAAALMALARGYRMRGDGGDDRRAIGAARAALRDSVQAVLLEDAVDRRLGLAREANERMADIVGWCLEAGDAESAVVLLEAGRGLLLHAATTTGSVAAVLARTDHRQLAEAWLDDSADVGVRARGLAALGRSLAGYHLLAAPEAILLASATWGLGTDAIVYLIPGAGEAAGRALILRSDHPVDHVALAALRSDAPELTGYLDTRRGYDETTDPYGSAEGRAWLTALDRLCEWAWTAAIGPLLDRTAQWGPQRAPRLAVVATGGLAAVPWHAAREPAGSRRACVELVLSYAASGRLLADVARRPPVATPVVAFVADPTGSLGWAAIGARATRAAFYPDAAHLGLGRRAGDPAGTRAEVLALLTDGTRSLVQLSTHTRTKTVPTETCFVLADGELSVAEILARADDRPADAPGGTVICDACATDLTEAEPDEALTLSTALLTAGWATAIGTRWPVDDQSTAVLTFVLHRFLRRGLRPADAVRAMQLWALNPDREVPREMPPSLARRARDATLADPYVWAAFAYHGR